MVVSIAVDFYCCREFFGSVQLSIFARFVKFKVLKKLLLSIAFVSAMQVAFSQEYDGNAEPEQETGLADEQQIPDFLPEAVDTVDTDDKFVKIVLYNNKTWDYVDFGRPVIDDTDFDTAYWNNNIHSYKEVPLSELPDEIDLMLVDSAHSFCAPITGRITSRYSFRKTRNHNGTDIKLEVGDPIRAAFDGKVRVSEYTKRTGGYGNLIVIRHPNGLETYYAHLSARNVQVGEIVKAGEIIGKGGNTGRSTGSHLHFEMRYRGQSFDPERLVDFQTGALRDTLYTIKKHYFSIYSHYGQTDEESYAESQHKTYKIKSGDTLSGIAMKNGTTVSNLCKLNGIKSTTMLRVGRTIFVR